MITPLGADTFAIAEVENATGGSPVVLVCEHSSNKVPAEYDNLGLDAAALSSHVAWDPGALAVAQEMSSLLDAPLVAQRVSRLLYDCNRPPESPSAVPERSEIYDIPGNGGLTVEARASRAARFYSPFRDLLAQTLSQRAATSPVVVTIHTFTPVYHGARRVVEIGILHDTDARLADAMLSAAGSDNGLAVRRNDPYGPADGVTHTLREHALPGGLLNVMVEIRNDLVATSAEQTAMARRLTGWLATALDSLGRPIRVAVHSPENEHGKIRR